jgi:hypothetical protein
LLVPKNPARPIDEIFNLLGARASIAPANADEQGLDGLSYGTYQVPYQHAQQQQIRVAHDASNVIDLILIRFNSHMQKTKIITSFDHWQ